MTRFRQRGLRCRHHALRPVEITAADYAEQEYRLTRAELARAAKKSMKKSTPLKPTSSTATSGPPSPPRGNHDDVQAYLRNRA